MVFRSALLTASRRMAMAAASNVGSLIVVLNCVVCRFEGHDCPFIKDKIRLDFVCICGVFEVQYRVPTVYDGDAIACR